MNRPFIYPTKFKELVTTCHVSVKALGTWAGTEQQAEITSGVAPALWEQTG